jgi:hypothetical protein
MAKMIEEEEEEDKTIELFFACSYDGQNPELPIAFSDYLKVKAIPKIIFVNGQWRLAKYTFGENLGPTQPKKPYWYDGNDMIDYAKIYFKLNEKYKLNHY